MGSLPADEDYARSVLAIFVLKHVRARESLAYADVETEFLLVRTWAVARILRPRFARCPQVKVG